MLPCNQLNEMQNIFPFDKLRDKTSNLQPVSKIFCKNVIRARINDLSLFA